MAYLPRRVKVLVDADLDVVKQYGVDGGVELVSHQLLDVLLYLGSELLILTYE